MLPLEVPIDAINNLLGRLDAAAATLEGGDFEGIGSPMTEFGSFENKSMLDQQHHLAHGAVLATVKSQIKSIESFRDALKGLQSDLRYIEDANEGTYVRIAVNTMELSNAADMAEVDAATENYAKRERGG